MNASEAAAFNDDKTSHAHRWRPSVSIGTPFGNVAQSVIEEGATRVNSLEDTLARPTDDKHVLALTLPSKWFDHAAEQICDILHGKKVYINRARAHSNATCPKAKMDNNTVQAYNVQFYLQLVSVLWRWNSANDDRPWLNSNAHDTPANPAPRKRSKRPVDMQQAADAMDDDDDDDGTDEGDEGPVLGSQRPDCALLIDWRWRDACDDCIRARNTNTWGIILCDHVEKWRMSPVLDYTFWFVVNGWSDTQWIERVAYATVVVMMRLHLAGSGNMVNWETGAPVATPTRAGKKRKKGGFVADTTWNDRMKDHSDMWKDVSTVQDFAKIAKVYLQDMGVDRRSIAVRVAAPKGTGYTYRALLGNLSPSKIYSPSVSLKFISAARLHGGASVLLGMSTMELQLSDIKNSSLFWKRYLPHYDFLSLCTLESLFPGVYHRDHDSFEQHCVEEDASHSIKFVPSTRSQGRALLLPLETNAESTTITRAADEFHTTMTDHARRLESVFMVQKRSLFTDAERAFVPIVWESVVRKIALARYILYCRSSEAHLSHCIVMLWHEFERNDGVVYQPEAIRPLTPDGQSNLHLIPFDYYYHNLTTFANFQVNRAYQYWDYLYIHPPHVTLQCLMTDCATNSTRGERDAVSANLVVHSTDPGAGKSFTKKTLMEYVRVPGTSCAVSNRSAASRSVTRDGTDDDMLICEDEMKRKTFINKEEGGMADPEVKELMSTGKIRKCILGFTKGQNGDDERDVMIIDHREITTVIGSANLQLMDVKDLAFLSRWLVTILNEVPPGVVKRPCEKPKPPAHIIAQFHQLQYAVAEVHKMVQIGAMVVEDTILLDVFMHALKRRFHEIGNTYRKDTHIQTLARIHAIHDLVITHFWMPGGAYYNKTITPTRLASLTGHLYVKAEHVVFAIGQVSKMIISETETLVKLGIRYMWMHPQQAFPVEWGKTTAAPGMTTSGPYTFLGHVDPVDVTCYDAILFRGRTFGFLKIFAAALGHVIKNKIIGKGVECSNPPTCDQILSHLLVWQTKMRDTARASLRDRTDARCSPHNIEFLPRADGDPASTSPMCQWVDNMGLQFPADMIANVERHKDIISGTPLEALLSKDREIVSARLQEMMAQSHAHESVPPVPVFLYGDNISDRPDCYDVLRPCPQTDPALLPYRFYARVMSGEEYTRISGNKPPASGEQLVPLCIPLDELAMRSRIKTLRLDAGSLSNEMFGRILGKMVLSDWLEDDNADEVYATFRKTMLMWSTLYQRSGVSLFTDWAIMRDTAKQHTATGVHDVMGSLSDELSAESQLIRTHIAMRTGRDAFAYTRYNNYSYSHTDPQRPHRVYPDVLPELHHSRDLLPPTSSKHTRMYTDALYTGV